MPDHLALVACGAPLAARVHEVAAAAVEAGWLVRVLATPAALAWVDQSATEQATGYPVLTEQRQPDQAKRFPPPAQVIVCPATFNTVNKLAAGIMDNYPAGLLCEALASRIPITAVPMVSNRLWDHPVWQANLEMLTAAGVTFLDIHTGRPGKLEPVVSGTGDEAIAAFDPRMAAHRRPTRTKVLVPGTHPHSVAGRMTVRVFLRSWPFPYSRKRNRFAAGGAQLCPLPLGTSGSASCARRPAGRSRNSPTSSPTSPGRTATRAPR